MTKHDCLTPGATWSIEIHPGRLKIDVVFQSMRHALGYTEAEATALEDEIHHAVAAILGRTWRTDVLEYAALKAEESKGEVTR
jgi:hypothetical protein